MKKVFFLNILILLFSTCVVSCQAQLMKTIQDAPELVKNKDRFIDKPLKKLLSEIKPPIVVALGDPDNNNPSILSAISFRFTSKSEYNKRKMNGEDPTRILVTLKRGDNNNKLYPKLDPNIPWSDEQTKIYGDMIVVKLAILGKD